MPYTHRGYPITSNYRPVPRKWGRDSLQSGKDSHPRIQKLLTDGGSMSKQKAGGDPKESPQYD